jgi:choline dehydrogenase
MESDGGASIIDLIVRDGKRQSIFRSYTFPYMGRSNLTVLTHALVSRVTFEGTRATCVELLYGGKTHRIRAGLEVVLCLGAINTQRCSCNPVSATKLRCSDSESPSCSIFRV